MSANDLALGSADVPEVLGRVEMRHPPQVPHRCVACDDRVGEPAGTGGVQRRDRERPVEAGEHGALRQD